MGAYRPPKVDKETRRKMEISEQFKKRSGSGPTISPVWIVLLLFALVGGGLFEFGGVIWDYGVWVLGKG